MAFPKKISRKIAVADKEYQWAIVNKIISNLAEETRIRLEEARKAILEKNPALKKNPHWAIILDPPARAAHWTKTTLYIIEPTNKHKATIVFNSIDFYEPSPRYKFEYLDFLSISPSIVRSCIEYLEANQLWTENLTFENGSELFRLQVIRALKKDNKWLPKGLEEELGNKID